MYKRIVAVATVAAAFVVSGVALADVVSPQSASPVKQSIPQPVPVVKKCVVSQKFHARAAIKTYSKAKVSKASKNRLNRLRNCAKSPKALSRMEAIEAQIKKERKLSRCGSPTCNMRLGRLMAARKGWVGRQWQCLKPLWGPLEGGWKTTADNPTSDAYGIPQALPGSKMGPGWQSNPVVQISWGLRYIANRYGTPCGAHSARLAKGWY